jgi:hypothetical protein
MLFFLFSYCCYAQDISAHEGHGHSHDTIITIGKNTFAHLQSILLTYQVVYSHLVKKELSEITDLAKQLEDSAQQGIRTESKGAGHHMIQHILEGAGNLKKAKSLQESQEAFASISNALFPFFESWPNQLKRNGLKICHCKKGHRWLQPKSDPTVCPYSSAESLIYPYLKEGENE